MELNQRLLLFLIPVLVAISTGATAQNITTLTPTPFNASGGLSVDDVGNIYVANQGTQWHDNLGIEVYKVTPSGEVSVFAEGFLLATGNTFDSEGNLYQSSLDVNRVDRVTPNGVVTTFADGTDGLAGPTGLAFDSEGNLYVANCDRHTIVRIAPNGDSEQFFGGRPPLDCPNGLAFDNEDNLYVTNFQNSKIIKITPDAEASVLADSQEWTGIRGSNSFMIFARNRLYFAGNGSHRVFELSLTGELKPLAGNGMTGRVDGPLLEASLQQPVGIGISPDGRYLYVNTSEEFLPLTPNVVRVIELPDAASEFVINPGLNDAWFNADTAGQGFFIIVFEDTGIIFMAWFTYDTELPPDDVQAFLGAAEHRWLTAQGPYDGDTATLDVFLTEGGIFDMSEPAPMTGEPIGTITIVWADCENGILTYDIDPPGVSGEIPITRIVPDNVALCEAFLEGDG